MPHRIVVIDDSAPIVQLYQDLLTGEGYDVVATFAEPPTDPYAVGDHHPDLIIMDWLFGKERTGMHTLEMLRTYPPTAGIPVIVCTAGHKSLTDVESILTQRRVRILHKPFGIDDLLAMVEQLIAQKHSLV